MSFKNQIKYICTAAALTLFSSAHAGNEGVFFYYGAGAGAMSIDEKSGELAYDPAGFGAVFAGIEEDGWLLEYTAFQTLETSTESDFNDYVIDGNIVSLGYRTIEQNRSYYKIAYAKVETDSKLIFTPTDQSVGGKLNGKSISLGYGMRLQSGNRIELDYSFFDPESKYSDVVSKAHLISLRYVFGGAPAFEK